MCIKLMISFFLQGEATLGGWSRLVWDARHYHADWITVQGRCVMKETSFSRAELDQKRTIEFSLEFQSVQSQTDSLP